MKLSCHRISSSSIPGSPKWEEYLCTIRLIIYEYSTDTSSFTVGSFRLIIIIAVCILYRNLYPISLTVV